MQPAARTRILETVSDDARVLDVGGWARPFPRADWILDLGSYETRGSWGWDGPREEERFSAQTWVQRDLCDREPWPFEDDFFDFAICSHTLEDVRDPVWACAELARVARAGYVEVPSRLGEQAWGVQGSWVGWGHHHWLVDIDEERSHLDFVFKHHVIHNPGPDHFAEGFYWTLTQGQRVQGLWWTGTLTARERVFDEPRELLDYLRSFVAANGPPGGLQSPVSRMQRLRGRLRR